MNIYSLFYILCFFYSMTISCSATDGNNSLKQSEDSLNTEFTRYQKDNERINIQFSKVSLYEFVKYIENMFDVVFITPDTLSPLPENSKSLKGHVVSFETNKVFSKDQVWSLFLNLLKSAGFAVIPGELANQFRIIPVESVEKHPLKTFIGIPVSALPDNDEFVRYIYFVKNASLEALVPVINSLKSNAVELVVLQEHKAFLMIDTARNLKSLFNVIRELDKVSMPQAMSRVELNHADANDVKVLLEALIQDEGGARLFPARKQPTSLYFPENIKIVVEKRKNILFLFGSRDALDKMESFIRKIDTDINKPYSPLYVYPLRYAEAQAIADILKDLTSFGKEQIAGQVGGIRSGDQYLKSMTFTPEPATNRLIIRGSYEDYLMVKAIIEQLDEPQPQIGFELLVLGLSFIETKQLGAQIRSSGCNSSLAQLLGNNVTFQTSGLKGAAGVPQGIVTNPNDGGILRLLGDLISLAAGNDAGNTLVSLGDSFGVWAIFQALDSITSSDVIANPFYQVTNKTKARISVGETRRVVTSTVVGAGGSLNGFDSDAANLTVEIIPQINSDGMIVLDLSVVVENFIGISDPLNVAKTTRLLTTNIIVANKEVIALGGLVQDAVSNGQSNGFPVLSKIPIFGWMFKNQSQQIQRDNLLVLITAYIIDNDNPGDADKYSQEHIASYYDMASSIYKEETVPQDPIDKLMFEGPNASSNNILDNFLARREYKLKTTNVNENNVRKRRKKKNSNKNNPVNSVQERNNANSFKKSAQRLLDKGKL